MGESYTPKGSKDTKRDQVHQTSCALPLWCTPMNRLHNGPQFISQAFQRFCNKFRIQSVLSTAYYPATNGLAEAFNKTIGKLLKKFISKSQHD